MVDQDAILCPDCQVELAWDDIDEVTQTGQCRVCGRTLELIYELWPSAPAEALARRLLQQPAIPPPNGMKVKLTDHGQRQTLTIRGLLGVPKARFHFDRRHFTLESWERTLTEQLEDLLAFCPVQRLWPPLLESSWKVIALMNRGDRITVFTTRTRPPARYLAAKLNESLSARRASLPYRS